MYFRCQTGLPVAPDFQGLPTFNKGGTVAKIGSGGNPILCSPGHEIRILDVVADVLKTKHI